VVKPAAVGVRAEATMITAQRFWARVPLSEVSHEPCQTNTPVARAPVTFLCGGRIGVQRREGERVEDS
jgi:hypothetical protein